MCCFSYKRVYITALVCFAYKNFVSDGFNPTDFMLMGQFCYVNSPFLFDAVLPEKSPFDYLHNIFLVRCRCVQHQLCTQSNK